MSVKHFGTHTSHTHTHTRTHAQTHRRTHAHAHTQTHTHTHTNARTHAHTHTHTHARILAGGTSMQQYGKAGMVGGQGVPSPAARPGGPAQGSAVPLRPGVPTVRRVL